MLLLPLRWTIQKDLWDCTDRLHIERVSSWSQDSLLPSTARLCFPDDTTGTHSVYTVYQGHEIVFHVSTMLPYSKENKQQVRVNTQPVKS